MQSNIRLAFDLGGSSIKYTCDELKTIHTLQVKQISKQYVLEFIAEQANQFKAHEICISAPGIIDSKSGKIWGLSAIQDWMSDDIFSELKILLKNKETHIFIDNDGNCALLGCVFNLKKPVHSALSIVYGTGIGAAYYCDGKINKGFNNSMGELGMMFSGFDADNNISTVLSTNALCVLVNQTLKTSYNGQQVFEAYTCQTQSVVKLVDQWITKNAKFIYNMIWAFDPAYIFIGGALAANATFQGLLLSEVDHIFKKIQSKNKASIVFAQQGNESNLLGALLLSR